MMVKFMQIMVRFMQIMVSVRVTDMVTVRMVFRVGFYIPVHGR